MSRLQFDGTLNTSERRFALWISSSHGFQHFLRRIFPPLIPIWVVTFDFPLALAGLLLGVQSLGSAIGQAPFGILSDKYDRRYILPTGIAFASIFVALFATVPFLEIVDVVIPVAGRDIQLPFVIMCVAMFAIGLGGSVLHPTGYPLISENVREERKGSALGMWGSAAKLGDGTAPAVVGVLLLVIAWNDILILMSLCVGIYSVVLFFVLRNFETRPANVIASTEESSPQMNASPAPGDASTAANRPRDRRVYLYPMLVIFAFFAIRMLAAGGVNVFIPEFITSEYGYSFTVMGVTVTPESTASFYYSALLITASIAQLGTGRLVDIFDSRKVIITMLTVAAVLLFTMAFVYLPPLLLFGVLLLMGGSMWALNPARDAIVSEITPAEREGRTFGYLWTGALIVSSISPVLVGYIGDTVGLRTAFAVLAVTTIISIAPIALLFSDHVWVPIDDPRSTPAASDQDD